MVNKAVVAGTAAGGVIGLVAGLIIKNAIAQGIPADIMAVLKNLSFRDVQTGIYYTNVAVLQNKQIEVIGSVTYEDYIFGVGQFGAIPNHIIVSIGKNTSNNTYSGVITKLAWDSIQVYYKGVLITTLAQFTAANSLYSASYPTAYT